MKPNVDDDKLLILIYIYIVIWHPYFIFIPCYSRICKFVNFSRANWDADRVIIPQESLTCMVKTFGFMHAIT